MREMCKAYLLLPKRWTRSTQTNVCSRFINKKPIGKVLVYSGCGHELGVQTTYKKENRPAYRLFQDSVKKRITTQASAE